MLLLTSVADRLQLVTDTAATLDVHVSWVDTAGSTVTPGRANTNIAAATTTSVAGNPAGAAQRNVKTLHIRNKHATLVSNLIVKHTDGATAVELFRCVLKPNDMLEYTDQGGFELGLA